MAQSLLSSEPQHNTLPESYVRPEAERPRLAEVLRGYKFPIIDLCCTDESQIIRKVAEACRSYGFFQVVNHGITTELLEGMIETGREFFHLPPEEKAMLYSDDPSKPTELFSSINITNDPVRNWRDTLRLNCYPLDRNMQHWPSTPPSLKDVMGAYAKQVRQLAYRLFGILSLGLGLDEDYIEKVLGENGQKMSVPYYPRCPEPDLTFGAPPHSDPNTMTILLQDQVGGLQVFKEGKWFAVDPHPGALVINIGDQLQALSNAVYKSVWHRVVVNSTSERISVATFFIPSNSTVISPPEKLVTSEGSPAIYRAYTFGEYLNKFWNMNYSKELCLEH